MLLVPEQNDSHVVDVAGWKQKPWCWSWNKTKSHVVNAGGKQKPYCSFWNKTNDMLLMLEQNKISMVDSGTEQTTCCRMKTKARSRSKTKALSFILEQNKRHVIDAGAKQNQHWFPNKTNDMLLMLPAENKGHFVDAREKQKQHFYFKTIQTISCWCQNKTKAMLTQVWPDALYINNITSAGCPHIFLFIQ